MVAYTIKIFLLLLYFYICFQCFNIHLANYFRIGREFSKVAGAGSIYVDLPATLENVLTSWLASSEKLVVFLQRL
jgi:hypothetical protein